MKKFIILTSLFAMNAQGMPESPYRREHIRMCSTPGGLWSLEKECYIHNRAFSIPSVFKLSVNQESKDPHPKKTAKNSISKKQRSSNSKKKTKEKSSERSQQRSETKTESHEPINSVRQNVIDARNQQQKTDQNVKRVLKRKHFEKKFTNFLGNNIGKFVADKLFLIFRNEK